MQIIDRPALPKIMSKGMDAHREVGANPGGHRVEFGLHRSDKHERVAVARKFPREMKSDPARRAGDQSRFG